MHKQSASKSKNPRSGQHLPLFFCQVNQ
jgi:hypothetical protein